jgi:carbonic anhydrase
MGPEVLASIEYGVGVLGAPLVVVLGHDSCGALQAATAALADGAAPAGLSPIVDGVVPSILRAHASQVTDPDGIGEIHVRRTVDTVAREASMVRAAVAAGRCAVIGMTYRLAVGQVTTVAAAGSPPEPVEVRPG